MANLTHLCLIQGNVTLTHLDVSMNGFGNEGAQALSELLKANTTLLEVNAANNRINWIGAKLIADGLRGNETLEILRVCPSAIALQICWTWYKNCRRLAILSSLKVFKIRIRKRFRIRYSRSSKSATRSTSRAQTPATPSLKSVKQCTQAWNSVAYCFLCPYPEKFMNVHPSGIPWCCQPTFQKTSQKIEKGTLCPRGQTDHLQNVPDCSLCHSQKILTISWKFAHRFYHGVANKHVRGA